VAAVTELDRLDADSDRYDNDDNDDDDDAQEERTRKAARDQSSLSGSRQRSGGVLPAFQVIFTYTP